MQLDYLRLSLGMHRFCRQNYWNTIVRQLQEQSQNDGIIGAEIGAYSSKISLTICTVAMHKVEYKNIEW